MTLSDAGKRLLERLEGLRTKAYRCSAGRWTIGIGHTGKDVVEGLEITEERARELFSSDLKRFEDAVSEAPGLTQEEFDALVCFAFNVGTAAFRSSTLLRKLKAGDKLGAANELDRWVHIAGGFVDAGLVKRRDTEKQLFLTGDYDEPSKAV